MLADLVNRADVGMIQSRGRPRFAAKTFEGLCVPGELVGQELLRDKTTQFGVFRLVYDTHAPAAELVDDVVMRDGLADDRSAPEPACAQMLVSIGAASQIGLLVQQHPASCRGRRKLRRQRCHSASCSKTPRPEFQKQVVSEN